MLALIGDHRIHYDLMGPDEGEVVCLVHGLLMDTGVWVDQVAALHARGFRVLRVDLRGHGGSDVGEGRFGPEQLAGDLLALLDHLQIDAVHYVGLSLGGVVGQALALSNAARLRSLVLCSTPTATFEDAHQAWRSRALGALKTESTASAAAGSLGRWFPSDFAARRPAAYQRIRDTAASTRPEGYAGCLEALQGYDYDGRLQEIRLPTLVICGAADTSTDARHHKSISDRIAGSEYHALPGTGHLPNVERPELFNRILTDWLSAPRTGADR